MKTVESTHTEFGMVVKKMMYSIIATLYTAFVGFSLVALIPDIMQARNFNVPVIFTSLVNILLTGFPAVLFGHRVLSSRKLGESIVLPSAFSHHKNILLTLGKAFLWLGHAILGIALFLGMMTLLGKSNRPPLISGFGSAIVLYSIGIACTEICYIRWRKMNPSDTADVSDKEE